MITYARYLRELDALIHQRGEAKEPVMLRVEDLYSILAEYDDEFAKEAWRMSVGSGGPSSWYRGDGGTDCPVTYNALWFNYVGQHWPRTGHPSEVNDGPEPDDPEPVA